MQSESIEQIIEAASELKESMQALYEAYGLMPAVIDKEHRAIKASDYNEVVASRDAKEVIADRIEERFHGLTRISARLAQLHQVMLDREVPRPACLSECVAVVGAICASLPGTDLGNQVLKHVQTGLHALLKDFENRYVEVKPLIEANSYVVSAMLRNFQESYRFWNEVSEQLAISYNQQGVQKAAGRNSGFKVRA